MRVLVVAREGRSREALSGWLAEREHESVPVEDAASARTALEADPIPLVLVDYASQPEAAATLRSVRPTNGGPRPGDPGCEHAA